MAPPSAIDIERVLLGAALLGATTLLTVAEILPPGRGQWFYLDAHQYIYDAMATLLERHDPIDLEIVTDVLRRRGTLTEIGGSVYLAELTECVVTTANIAHHARIIRDKALYRGMINIGSDISASAYAQEDLPGLINRMQEALLSISGAQSTSAFSTLHDLMTDTIRNAQHADERDLTGVHTGFHGLNSLTSGFQNANLIIVAARPSQGKSALALQFALAAAQSLNNLPVAMFSLEMSSEELGMRILCSEARVDSQRMKRGFLDRDEWALIMTASHRIDNLQILIDDTSSLSVLDVRTRAKRLQTEHGLGLVVITDPQKRCSRCKAQKPLKEFSKDRRHKDGRASQCKSCDALRLKTYYENVLSKSEEFRQRNNAKAKEYYKNNKEHIRKYKAEYYQANKEKLSNEHKTYYQEHKEDIKRQHHDYYESHKPAHKLTKKRYHENNPSRSAEDRHRRRVRERHGICTPITTEIRQFILQKQGNKCSYCRRRFTKDNRVTVDHITPISRGGSHTLDNIVYACMSCNSKKHAGPPPCPVQPFLPLAM